MLSGSTIARVALLALVGSALAGCAADSADPGENEVADEEPIVGGELDKTDPAVVAINVELTGMAVCTGTLIAPDVVLTAGHCPMSHIWIRQGSSVRGLGWLSHTGVKDHAKHPRFSGEGKRYDVALLRLANKLGKVRPLPLSEEPLSKADIGAEIRHVGFGTTGDDWSYVKNIATAGLKRDVTYPITNVDRFFLWSGAPGKQTCVFDSGGPALRTVHGVERIIGVVSAGRDCHSDGWDTRVDRRDILSWIDATLKAWGTERPRAGKHSSHLGR